MKIYAIWYIGGDDIHLRIPLLLNLKEAGFEVGVLGSESGDIFRSKGIAYVKYPLNRRVNPLSDFQSILALRKHFNNAKIDLVHAFDTKPGFLVPIAKMLSGEEIVVVRTITGMGHIFSWDSPVTKTLRPIYRGIQKRVSSLSEHTVFQNEDDAEYFQAHEMIKPDQFRIIQGSGVDSSYYDPNNLDQNNLIRIKKELKLEEDVVVITLISRLVSFKGISEFLKSAQIIHRNYPKIIFLLIGPLESDVEHAIPIDILEEYSKDVLYLGERRDIKEILALTDIFVLPSYYREGIPRVLLEAGSMALPIITSNMPGCKEVVRDGWNGYLIPPRNVEALVNAINKLVQDKALRNLMGKRSRDYVISNFELERITREHMSLYKSLLEN